MIDAIALVAILTELLAGLLIGIKSSTRGGAEPFGRLGARMLRQGAPFIFSLACVLVSLIVLTITLKDFLQVPARTEIAALSICGCMSASRNFACYPGRDAKWHQCNRVPQESSPGRSTG
jgi:hypothetical protein